jgi:DNA polymerase V
MKMYALVDCNNFFVSCERLFSPHLNAKPVVVLSSNDGCVVARSQEVKDLGIPMGIPYFKIKDIITKEKITVFSSNFQLYRDMSSRVMNILKEELVDVYPYSIDEAFLEISHVHNPRKFAMDLRAKILRLCGMPLSIGIAPTKTLAKLANAVAKKRPDGVAYIECDNTRKQYLHDYSVGQVWGIGKMMTEALVSQNILTAYDFQKQDTSWIQKKFGVTGVRIAQDLRGIDATPLHEEGVTRKSIISSRSFGKKINDIHILKQSVAHHIASVARQLRKEGLCAHRLLLYIQTSLYTQGLHVSKSESVYFDIPTQDVLLMTKVSMEKIEDIFEEGIAYSKSGVAVSGLIEQDGCMQINLFQEDVNPMKSVQNLLNNLDTRYGDGTLRLAAEGFVNSWSAKSQRQSPAYTTSWSEIALCA